MRRRIGTVDSAEPADAPMSAVILAELLDAMAGRRAVALCTVVATQRSVPRRSGAKMLVYADGSTSGTIGGGEMESRVIAEALDALAARSPRRLAYALVDPASGDPGVCGGEVELYVEPHMPQSTLYLIGAGHVGKAVAELATWLGHRVIVWDDRPDQLDDISGVEATHSGAIEDALAAHPIDEHTCVVMVTRNVDLDATLLPPLLATPAPYIGLMGSQRRWATTRAALTAAGVAEDQLARVRSPIGVDISAETPEEIAVSILAEVIAGEHGR